MKRFLIILMIAATALLAVGCYKESSKTDTPATEGETKLHTIQPDDADAQPEWAPVDCDIELRNTRYVYAQSTDFLTFALVGKTDEDCELQFTIDEVTSGMLSQQDASTEYFLSLDGQKLRGTVSFSDDFGKIYLKGGYTYDEMCALATKIRGL